MKIAITTGGPSIESKVEPDFGGAEYVVLVDTETGTWEACANPAPRFGGHGMAAARFVAMNGANAVVSGDYCPHAFAALRSIGVGMYEAGGDVTATTVVERLREGALTEAPQPTGHGHHGRHGHQGHHGP
ncbi:MAG TPA: NifB/NifX family molybdenum-iron cluster-binding protein [Chloroflexota bacterium]|nr:NifB/NifX family molybdenum-iron cluster-binding protein [Chloroflexota bacterium]